MEAISLNSTPKLASSTASPSWDYDQLRTAVAAVNDTSGATSLETQMDAYQSLWNYANNGTDVGDTRKEIVTGYMNSAFMQRTQAVLNSYSTTVEPQRGESGTESASKRLNAFNSMSSDDQKILANGNGGRAEYGGVSEFAQSLNVRLDIAQATEETLAKANAKSLEDSSDPTVAVLRDLNTKKGTAWLSMAEGVLSNLRKVAADRVDLSAAARETIEQSGGSTNASTSQGARTYNSGDRFSQRV